jgi:hypothetical protein
VNHWNDRIVKLWKDEAIRYSELYLVEWKKNL